MGEKSGWKTIPSTGERDSDSGRFPELVAWGGALEELMERFDPLYQLEDLLQNEHPLRSETSPTASLVRAFGKGSSGEAFMSWKAGRIDSLPTLSPAELGAAAVSLDLEQQELVARFMRSLVAGIREFLRDWVLHPDRLKSTKDPAEHRFQSPLSQTVCDLLLSLEPPALQLESERPEPSLDPAIARVRSFFAPMESPLFGMNKELLTHHVQETIPRETHETTVTPIVPLFGKGHVHHPFPSTAQLPAHLRVLLHRLEISQASEDLVTALLATLESVDFTIRFTAGLVRGSLAAIDEQDFGGAFNPSTVEIINGLKSGIARLREHWDDPRAQPPLHLIFQGEELNPFLKWARFDAEPALVDWMLSCEEAVRQDNPARCAVLLSEVMESFNGWISELVLLCSSWDVVAHTRQDGYLQMSLGRGNVWISCKPLIDPTRYSVWLDRSELAAVNAGGFLPNPTKASSRTEVLDPRISPHPNDPPFLSEQIGTLLRAHEKNETLPLGRSLFFGLEYLVRLHASLLGGYLRHRFSESSLLDPILNGTGALDHTVFFLAYGQRILADLDGEEASLLRQVFFDDDEPRRQTKWLGIEHGVPGPLQGILGWSLSLMRPDACNRLDEVRGQVERLSSLFADFLQQSRALWTVAGLQSDSSNEGSEAVVLKFPSGLIIRGVPDVMIGPKLEPGRRNVVVGSQAMTHGSYFKDWGLDDVLTEHPEPESEDDSTDDQPWPSLFGDGAAVGTWEKVHRDAISRRCQSLSYSGPDARPRQLAAALSEKITSMGKKASTLTFVEGPPGSGRTFLCRTLTNPRCSPLPENFPVLYLRVDRFPETRLSTVVERLNDHIASEPNLIKLGWVPVPVEALRFLGTEAFGLSDEFSDFDGSQSPLSSRLSSYLRYLKILNGDRSLLLILDGFETLPQSIIPRALTPGVHVLITGSEFPDLGDARSPYLEFEHVKLDDPEVSLTAFQGQLMVLGMPDPEKLAAFRKFRGSILKARVFRDVRHKDEDYQASPGVLKDLVLFCQEQFPDRERYQQFLELLAVLGLHEKPIPLSLLEEHISDASVISVATETMPSLFAFWDEPETSLGLSHRQIFDMLHEQTNVVSNMALKLVDSFLDSPNSEELLLALSWIEKAPEPSRLIESFFNNVEVMTAWREQLAELQGKELFFRRVALLDGTEPSLRSAVEAGAGNLREELAWLYNARGLSLLELGLVDEAVVDFEVALQQFQNQFASGDTEVITAMVSATNRLSEAKNRVGDSQVALSFSERALELLSEAQHVCQDGELELLSARVRLQRARINYYRVEYDEVLSDLDDCRRHLNQADPVQGSRLRASLNILSGEVLMTVGQVEPAIEALSEGLDGLLQSGDVGQTSRTLILRGKLWLRQGQVKSAHSDFERALSLLRYQVALGRLDLEPLLAFAACQRVQTGLESASVDARLLDEFVDWGQRRVRYEGRSDLRPLLAYLLLCRGKRWREARDFGRALSDFRLATEQYDLLSKDIGGQEEGGTWAGLRSSFANLSGLYLSLDEPALALICGRKAVELSRLAGRETESFETSIELPALEFASLPSQSSNENPAGTRLYQTAKLNLNLGEACRRLGLHQQSSSYFERASKSFGQLKRSAGVDLPELSAEYCSALRFAARSSLERGDFAGLEVWVSELHSLPDGVLTSYDRFTLCCWSGRGRAAQGHFDEAMTDFQEALKVLAQLESHPCRASLEAETLLDLGRVLSLAGRHSEALEFLEKASKVSQNALFEEGEENRELLVLGALHSAVAYLRSGRRDEALNRLSILVSLRPFSTLGEIEVLTGDWAKAWESAEKLTGDEMLKRLGQMCQLGDWLLRTSLGPWFRKLVTEFIDDPLFLDLSVSSDRLDQILETFLVVTFGQSESPFGIEQSPEIQQLLRAKLSALSEEGRVVEAELVLSHLLPTRRTPETGALQLRRSEMALLRGDRGLAIVDLVRASENHGSAKFRAHMRLAEFLLSRELFGAAQVHLHRCYQEVATNPTGVGEILDRGGRVLSRLVKVDVNLREGLLDIHLKLLQTLSADQAKPPLDQNWLKGLAEYRAWPDLLESTITIVSDWQALGHDKPADWTFLEHVLDWTLLVSGQLGDGLLDSLGHLLAGALSSYDTHNLNQAERVWERFVGLLPLLEKSEALALLQRLFDTSLRTSEASAEGHGVEFLHRLEHEKRLLCQPV